MAKGVRAPGLDFPKELYFEKKLCPILCPIFITNHSNWAQSGREAYDVYWCEKSTR